MAGRLTGQERFPRVSPPGQQFIPHLLTKSVDIRGDLLCQRMHLQGIGESNETVDATFTGAPGWVVTNRSERSFTAMIPGQAGFPVTSGSAIQLDIPCTPVTTTSRILVSTEQTVAAANGCMYPVITAKSAGSFSLLIRNVGSDSFDDGELRLHVLVLDA